MTSLRFIDVGGNERVVEATNGQSVMRAARDSGIDDIVARCGGTLACATCHVYISDQSAFDAPSELEEEMLEGVWSEQTAESRLSCQLDVSDACDGLIVRTPDGQG